MRKRLSMIVMGICVCCAVRGWAQPTGSYDAVVTETTDHFLTTVLGDTFDFDYWFESNAAPGSYRPGLAWDVMVAQTTGDWSFLGQISEFYPSSDWKSASLDIPAALRGLEREVRFRVNDLGPDTDPSVYLRFDGDNDVAPVPEPSSLLLLGTGLLGAMGWKRSFGKKAQG